MFTLDVFQNGKSIKSLDFSEPIEIGRQNKDEPAPIKVLKDGTTSRLIVAPYTETTVSRRHILVEPVSRRSLRIQNLSLKIAISCQDAPDIPPQQSAELNTPTMIVLGDRAIRIRHLESPSMQAYSLPTPTRPPGQTLSPDMQTMGLPLLENNELDLTELVNWFRRALEVVQAAADSPEFFENAVKAVVDLVKLDTAAIILLEDDEWQVVCKYSDPEISGESDLDEYWRPSSTVLQQLLKEKRTYRYVPDMNTDQMVSVASLTSVLGSPILNPSGDVIGVVYADRRRMVANSGTPIISELEAVFVELVAGGVAAGLARVTQERAAVAARVRFEQFFTPQLSEMLAENPNLLNGRNQEVTCLFCDIRGFSRISGRLGPAGTVEWISDIMEELSQCVLQYQGVLVDYIGDELVAMWGAPQEQPDHAVLACKAAVAMLNLLPELNTRWESKLGEEFDLGIGLNSGVAHVGNIGSKQKFKYGPLGDTVNVASRVQGATKYLKSRLLITGETHSKLTHEFYSRRICQVKVVNITEPIQLFELSSGSQGDWNGLCDKYEASLEAYESGRFRSASQVLSQLLTEFPSDGPSLVLMSRTVNAILGHEGDHDAVWELPGK